ncbi:MAG: FAD-dependent oxidoreductase [Deltaproteobacteria bacterium]|nr:FAD-dependent oxidoreductase [Deltaproteobacteria bacterium]MBW2305395.1 FAD-dependent oxidoreductase [Deltaproteobacteria bacterium]
MMEIPCAVVGAGPAGLCAAIEAARRGVEVHVFDENPKPGGQLFKQIHKFFGSKGHWAGIRGINIGEQLLSEARDLGVTVHLETSVWGIFDGFRLGITCNGRAEEVRAKAVAVATGAMENTLIFPGWTLPGVMGAGAAQTMLHIFRLRPGEKALMVGSGNVGLIVAYQLLQAGCGVEAVLEALPEIGGYHVHAGKITRMGVPILTEHTIQEARGTDRVRTALIARIDPVNRRPIEGTIREMAVDLICIAVGLTPMIELLRLMPCDMVYVNSLGGYVPRHDERMMTTVPGLFVAGDASGIEEACTAMDEGRLAGIGLAEYLGYIDFEQARRDCAAIKRSLDGLRLGPFGEERGQAKSYQMVSD